MKNITMQSLMFYCLMCTLTSCSKTNDDNVIIPPPNSDTTSTTQPALTGKLVYHSYNSYGDAAKMFLYDFAANKLTNISANWNIYNPINAHFNNDGSAIVFMGEAVKDGKWDIYLWQLNSTVVPTNLTANDDCRDEDPKFSPDGLHICFKQTPLGKTGNLKVMDLNGNITNNVSSNSIESGMPYYTTDSKSLIYAQGGGSTSGIYIIDVDGKNNHVLYDIKNLSEYYPITMSDSTFLYTRWSGTSSAYDHVYIGYFDETSSRSLPFNQTNADYSDAFPIDNDNVVLSCDKAGGKGAYDLYIANVKTGKMWSLNVYNANINSSLNELGACYSKN